MSAREANMSAITMTTAIQSACETASLLSLPNDGGWRLRSATWVLLCTCLLLTVLSVLQKTVANIYNVNQVGLPRAFSVPWFGNLSILLGLPHICVTKLAKKYGKIFEMNIGSDKTFIMLNDVSCVLDTMRKFPTAMSGKPTSVTTRETGTSGAHHDQGKRWRRRRHLCMTAYKGFFRECSHIIHGVADEELETLIQNLQTKCGAQGYDLHHDITYFIARTMYRLTYGQGEEPSDSTCKQLHELVNKIDDYTQNAGPFSKLDRFPFLKKLQAASMDKYRYANKLFHLLCEGSAESRKASTEAEGDAHADLMSFFMRGAEGLTKHDEQTLDLNKDLLFAGLEDLIRAGTESPSLLLQWVLLCLSKFPDAQDKLADELKTHAKREQKKVICDENMDSIPYCQAVIYETVRYCSIVPFLKRKTLSDVIIDGHKVPKDTTIIINNHAINNDLNKWDNPETFNPERFLLPDGRFNKKKLDQFLPFGFGKRRCMGEELGKMLPFSAVATLVLNFSFSCQQNQDVDLTPVFGITLSPKAHKLVLTPRRTMAS